MKRLVITASVITLILGCTGGQPTRDTSRLTGRLLYTSNEGLLEFNLETRTERLLLEAANQYQNLSNVNGRQLLVDSDRFSPTRIQLLSLENEKPVSRDLHDGYRPISMNLDGKYLFLRREEDYRRSLHLASLDHPEISPTQIASSLDQINFTVSLIPVSDHEVLITPNEDDERTPPYVFDLASGSLRQLPLTRRCKPYLWRSATQELLCGVDWNSEFYLTSLDGARQRQVEFSGLFLGHPFPLVYIPGHDAVVVDMTSWSWFGRKLGEHRDVWLYYFDDRPSERLLESRSLSRGTIVWLER